jgi:hypothetical protein
MVNWVAASSGSAPLAAQINQFLTTHAFTAVYTGAEQDHQATAGSGAVDSNSLYIAQKFTSGGTYTSGRVVLTLAVTGTPAPWSLSLQSDNSGAPSGTILAGPVAVPNGFVPASAATVSIPLPGASITSGTVYWIVAHAAGDVSNFYAWSKSNQATGASTSANGSTWSAQAYGLLFQVWDSTIVTPMVHTWEDSAARWTTLAYNAQSTPSKISEYTVAQAANDYVSSVRSFTYTNGLPTSIA